jgi:hypothetical protein
MRSWRVEREGAVVEIPEPVAASPGRSRACNDDEHQECGHVSAAITGARRRQEATILLCRCPCHKACLLARRKPDAPVTVWRRRCACPGAEQARTTQGDPCEFLPRLEEFRETYERQSRLRSQAREDALKAARAAAPGKTRDEVRGLLVAEMQARGLEIPHERLLEVAVDLVTGDPRTGIGKLWQTFQRTFTDG